MHSDNVTFGLEKKTEGEDKYDEAKTKKATEKGEDEGENKSEEGTVATRKKSGKNAKKSSGGSKKKKVSVLEVFEQQSQFLYSRCVGVNLGWTWVLA